MTPLWEILATYIALTAEIAWFILEMAREALVGILAPAFGENGTSALK